MREVVGCALDPTDRRNMSVRHQPTDASPTAIEPSNLQTLEEGKFHIPQLLEEAECWLCYTRDPEREGQGKVPIDPTRPYDPSHPRRSYFDSTDPGNMTDIETALDAIARSRQEHGRDGIDGLGVSLSAVDDLVLIDVDHCLTEDETYTQMAVDLVEDLSDTYWEVSPSGYLHGFVLDANGLAEDASQRGQIEVYQEGYATVTGRSIVSASDSILRCDGLAAAYQRKYNGGSSSSESSASSGEGNQDSSSETSVTKEEAMENALHRDEYYDALDDDVDDLPPRLQKIVQAMFKYNEHGRELYQGTLDNDEMPSDWIRGDGKLDESKRDACILERLVFWSRAGMFDFEISQAEVERAFLASPVADRPKVIDRPDYVAMSALSAIKHVDDE